MQSQFSDALQELQTEFIDRLPERIGAIRSQFQKIDASAWRPEEAATLHRLVHGLTGSAGTFGMQSLSDTARDMEIRLSDLLRSGNTPTDMEWQTVGLALDSLSRLAGLGLQTDAPNLPSPPTPKRANHSPLIDIIEDDIDQALHLQNVLQKNGFRTRVFSEPTQFQTLFTEPNAEPPAAVIMDLIFPDGNLAGAEAVSHIKNLGKDSETPVIIVSVRDDIAGRLAAFRAGASRYLVKPVNSERIVDILDALTGRHPTKPYRVLLIDDDPLIVNAHAAELQAAGMEVKTSTQPLDILNILDNFSPDVAVLDVYMPEASGPELAAIIRERDEYLHLPILFLSGETDMTQQLLALSLGGDDFLVKPLQPRHLVAAVSARAHRARQNSALRLRLETTLYEREREHLAINHHAIISIADRSGNITYINDKFCEISGYRREELIGQNHRIVKSGEHSPEFYHDLWETIAGGRVWQGEICNRRKDGSLYWVESTITPFLGSNGKPYQYVSIRTDISHVKKSVQQLRLLERAVEASTSGIVIADANQHDMPLIFTNKAFERITGYPREEILGKNCRFLNNNDRHQPGLDHVRSALSKGEKVETVLRNYRKDGSMFWNELRIAPVHDEQGNLTHFIGIIKDVSERVRGNEALKKGEQNLRATLESTLDGILAVDDSGSILFANRQFIELWRIPEELALPGQPDQHLLDTAEHQLADPLEFRKVVQNIYRSGQDSQDLLEFADGRIVERHSKPLVSEGKIGGRVWSFHDITEIKRAERSVEYHKERLRRGQIFANIGTWEWNIQSGDLFWSERIAPLFGYPDGNLETSYENFLNAIHPEDRQAVVKAVSACLEYDEPYNIEHRVIWPDGTERWLLERGAVVRDEGKPTQMLGVVQDIDDRKRAELALAEREKYLRIFQHIVDSVVDGVITIGADGIIHSFNPAACAIFGYRESDIVGRKVNELMPEPHRSEIDNYLQRYCATGTGKIINQQLEVAGLKADGNIFPLEIAFSQIKLSDDLLFVGLARDITERKRAEQALITARVIAERANQTKSDFLSNMSHELRTPMNAILGFGQLLQYDETLSDTQKEDVGEILKAGRHLLDLINEILDLAKIESGRISLSIEPVRVAPIIEECLSLVSTQADKRRISLRNNAQEDFTVQADQTRLKQTLLNLISNAIKYNREGGLVAVEAMPKDSEYLSIQITDTGRGIPKERLPELFQPFNRLDAENSAIEGTGIGLTISRRIVEMMGGAIEVESEVGVGSRFMITLPAASNPTLSEPPKTSAAIEKPALQSRSRQQLVLYIEDNPSNIRLVSQILERQQHIRLITAHTPELGIELARAHRPDLILLDINMPNLNGFQVLSIFQNDPIVKSAPVIAITANAMPRDIEQGKAAGFADYLTKPLDITQFNAVLEDLLNRIQKDPDSS
ncbi:PAS domain S-box protein [Methylotuvimicrobium alcaliphilum]|uniref:histidine kinase n=1 Tax=Methylotuvimicrobium alcaliphilum (strain DSM 19304 / NCIMB 14124 / VKM B-2133 / 20Z) TaxID=1091494 RepID=G4T0F8_META2|nr:PAS domain S-box protein [Methylotuvimicrobium alcaliphilum]CCE24550.1 Multi-sensor hybrid histidine kinase (modular protein) [Methylotuvimicrobium alcaliphilum 20Z]